MNFHFPSRAFIIIGGRAKARPAGTHSPGAGHSQQRVIQDTSPRQKTSSNLPTTSSPLEYSQPDPNSTPPNPIT